MRRLLIYLLVPLLFVMLAPAQLHVAAAAPDYDIPSGHFYTQAAGPNALADTGFAILDAGADERGQTIKFWSEYRRLGGVATLGYVASNRFKLNGFWIQATQRVLMQWRPEIQRVYFVNVFDLMHDMGLDNQLQAKYQVPLPVNVNDAGKPFNQVVAERQAYLNVNPAIKQRYLSVSDPLQLNGLPTAQVTDAGGVFDIIRCQRVVIQYWKKTLPGIANAGDVTVGLGGDMAKEFGLVPHFAQIPLTSFHALEMNFTPAIPAQGTVYFGDQIKDTGTNFELVNSRSSFIAGETVRYSAYLKEPAGTKVLQRTISFVLPNGAEQLLSSENRNLNDAQANLLAGGLTTQPGLAPGVYIFRFLRGNVILAEGVFGITSP